MHTEWEGAYDRLIFMGVVTCSPSLPAPLEQRKSRCISALYASPTALLQALNPRLVFSYQPFIASYFSRINRSKVSALIGRA